MIQIQRVARLRLLGTAFLFVAGLGACHEVGVQKSQRPEMAVVDQRSPTERLIELSQKDNRVVETARRIAKEHPKRLTGSKGYDDAAAWAVEQFRSYGLEAHLETWGEIPVRFDRGPASGRIVVPLEKPLEFSTSAWTAGTQGPARGRAVMEPRTQAELDALDTKTAFAGAWIIRTETKEPAKFRRALREAYDAAGILGIVRPSGKSGLLTMGGDSRVDPKALPKQVEIKLVFDQHADLLARLERGEAVELEFDVDNRFEVGPVPCTNVVADLVGARFPDEFVIVQGHFDAWDGAEGAQDNGTGCAAALEAARLIAALGVKPARTIRFVLYSGEEQGLLGSRGYVKAHKDELDKTSIVMTDDAGGTFLAGIDATYAMMADMRRVTAPLAGLDARFPFTLHEVDGLVNSGDSDHAPFIQAGVPSFFWHQSENGYEHVHHTQYDVFEQIPLDELTHSARVVALCAFGFANLETLLDRTDSKPLERRRLGVQLAADATLQRVMDDGRAKKAGWLEDDRIVAVDGAPVTTQKEVLEKLWVGGSAKVFRLMRGTETIESTIDYSDEPAEKERAARAERRAAFLASHKENG